MAPSYVKPSGCSVAALATDWYLEYVLDHFQNLINSLVVHNLPVPQSSYQSAPNSFSYSANNKTNMGQSTIPANLWRR